MDDQIICPNCRKPIPLTQALSHQLQEKYKKIIQDDRKRQAELYERKLQDEKSKYEQAVREQVIKKVKADMEMHLADRRNENEELKKQNKTLQDQLLELNKTLRQMRTETEQGRLDMEKKLNEAQEKIRLEESKRSEEAYRLKILEREKKLQDALKVNEELKRKLEQGSQQSQGEVLELELEKTLKNEFPHDEIKPVAKGIRGADVVQVVRDGYGRVCGTLIWESKRTKAWSNDWIMKLKEDQRQVKAEIAVIISETLPDGVKHIANQAGVWISDFESFTGLALTLRNHLMEMSAARSSLVNRKEKMAVLYNYLTSVEFVQRVEAIIEAFTVMQDDLEKERRWFALKWSKQEKSIRKVIDNTSGMYGDLRSIMGKSLAEVKGLEALPEEIAPAPAADSLPKDTLF